MEGETEGGRTEGEREEMMTRGGKGGREVSRQLLTPV